mmetsp:Transcript_47725/g.34985  ORF Transcript_47725/g.34985 Transcript_47725/m.34985 type:complete len:117 (-) Transcript_47725:839-1189(-)|eukprot:CAMPEP_0202970186 /NCGR_PEP_ID=MMETSP1396-20130829/16173_1 /ASSEMBLY_ACC=CAM_ASM_000872 /TAXON_ID= /ORGANISM="Pseudokeronopsis sp., Strain Brazil" /LENGTH=116 /DNA_ID=CAMNT_0049698541 /DNA_START=1871 /DNA_END=2221 /DNA_ORIENTATION=+
MTPQKVKYVTHYVDWKRAQLQRQFAASRYIETLESGKRIINIDESLINRTQYKKVGWNLKGNDLVCPQAQRLSEVSIVAAVSSQGELYYSINRGANNSLTIKYFLASLIKLLDFED